MGFDGVICVLGLMGLFVLVCWMVIGVGLCWCGLLLYIIYYYIIVYYYIIHYYYIIYYTLLPSSSISSSILPHPHLSPLLLFFNIPFPIFPSQYSPLLLNIPTSFINPSNHLIHSIPISSQISDPAHFIGGMSRVV